MENSFENGLFINVMSEGAWKLKSRFSLEAIFRNVFFFGLLFLDIVYFVLLVLNLSMSR